jgi:ABC-type Fe3+ transport system permease subunit
MKSFVKEFFEDPNGKSSMTRLAMLLLCLAAVVVALGWVVAVRTIPDKLTVQITTGFAAVLAALIANGIIALKERTTKEG